MELTASQKQALAEIDNFMNSKVQDVHCLSGSPGTGKSFLINIISNKYKNTLITATTNKASSVINGKTLCKAYGITLVANFKTGNQEYSTKYHKNIRNSLVIIDEASMLERELWQLIQDYSYNCKFLLVGDKYQLPAVGSTFDPFSVYPVSELTEVVRQSDKDFLKEIYKSREGVKNSVLYEPAENNCIHYLKTKKEVRDLLRTFGPYDKALSYTNPMSIDLAYTIRKLQGKGEDFKVGDTVSPKNYCEGINKTSLFTGEDLIISNIEEPEDITIDLFTVPVRRMNFEGIMDTFLVPVNYEYVQLLIKSFSKNKQWKEMYYCKEGLLDLRFNEASTVHCAQGSTYDRVFIHMTDIKTCRAHSVKSRLMYVALTRAKNGVYIYEE